MRYFLQFFLKIVQTFTNFESVEIFRIKLKLINDELTHTLKMSTENCKIHLPTLYFKRKKCLPKK